MRLANRKIILFTILILIFTGCTQKSIENIEPSKEAVNAVITDKNYEKTGVWSPDGKWIAVTTAGRTWTDTTIIDTQNNKEHPIGIFQCVTVHKGDLEYAIGSNQRPDPYVNFMEWCPDSKKLLLSFSFSDDLFVRQTGIAVFCLDKMAVDYIMKLGTKDEDHPEIDKPMGFDWTAESYGLNNARGGLQSSTKDVWASR